MTAMAQPVEQTEGTRDQVAQWRFEEAHRMGCDPALCKRISIHLEVDLHDLRALINSGCAHELAFRILHA